MNPDTTPGLWYRRRARSGKFWYRTPTGSGNPHELRHCAAAECGELFFGIRNLRRPEYGRFCSVHCSRLSFRKVEVTYRGLHTRIARERGKAAFCSIGGCVTGSSTFHWANLTGQHMDTEDYAPMCVWHHRLYDSALLLGMSPGEALKCVTAVPAEIQRTRSRERWAAANGGSAQYEYTVVPPEYTGGIPREQGARDAQ